MGTTLFFFIFQIIIFTSTISHGLTQDFCVADTSLPESPSGYLCKNIENVTADDFSFSFEPTNIIDPFKFGVKFGFAPQFHGVNGQGIGLARIDIAVGGTVPLHTHPRASELVLIISGTVVMGFITSDSNMLYQTTLNANDVMIVPRGLQHFQINTGKVPVTFYAILNNQNPGFQVTSFSMFGNDLSTDMVKSATAVSTSEIKRLKKLLGGSG
ncbi:Germin-like protein subfamily 3 member 3 [Zostera marina]|uniref:Germin-like protein n=1 Tax=Zostera marina TaxID=29655 RepID=A0A0K9Q5R0_ZOSMR|nr:Germin-like protein subfamily 3 member 3 [Zostera marina]